MDKKFQFTGVKVFSRNKSFIIWFARNELNRTDSSRLTSHLSEKRAAAFRNPGHGSGGRRKGLAAVTRTDHDVLLIFPAAIQPVVPGVQALRDHRNFPF